MANDVQHNIIIRVEDVGAEKTAGNVNKVSKATKNLSKESKEGSTSILSLGKSFVTSSLFSRRMFRGVSALGQGMASWFNEANDYVEAMNLFTVAMGSASKSALEFVQKSQNLLGLDSKEVMEYMGTFNMMLEGFGHTTEASAMMSQQLTQLAYDLSSLYNVDVATSFRKLSSGMAGQVKGLRDYGISVTVASLKETALRHNIDLSISKMTEAQKATLRYVTIMENSQNVQNDLARTILTPANSLRVLNNQWTLTKRAMGQVLSVIAVKVIPWFMALIKIIRALAESLASLFGYELPELDYSGLTDASGYADDLSDGLDKATKKAKKLQRTLMGFDEINRLDAPDTGSGGTGGGNSLPADLGLDLSEYSYDFFKGLEEQAVGYEEKLKKILELVGLIGGAFSLWKIGTTISPIISKIGEGLSWVAGFLNLPFMTVAVGIGLIASGLVAVAVGVYDVIKTGGSLKSWLAILGGAVAIVGGVFLLFGGIPALITGIVLGIGALALAIYKNAGGIRDKIVSAFTTVKDFVVGVATSIKEFFVDTWNTISETVSEVWGSITSTVSGVFTSVVNTVRSAKDSVVGFFADIWESIIGTPAVKSVINNINVIIYNIKAIFNKIVEINKKILEIFNALGKAFNIYVIQPIVTWLKEKYNAIVSKFEALIRKIKSTVSTVFNFIVGIISGKIAEIKEKLNAIKKFFDEKIVTPLKTWATNFYKDRIVPVIEKVKSAINTIKTFFNDKIITPLKKLPNWIKTNVVDKVIEKFKLIGTNIASFISGSIKGVINGIFSRIESSINKFIGLLNGSIDIINGIPGVNISKVEKLNLPRLYAQGGYPEQGQMFVARESGAELVGNIGSRTAVMNNDQIVSAVAQGVASAVASVMGGNSGQEVIINVDGKKLFDVMVNQNNAQVRRTGASPLRV